MARGKAEDAGGLTPAKDGNAALCHFDPRTLPIFKCVDYIMGRQYFFSNPSDFFDCRLYRRVVLSLCADYVLRGTDYTGAPCQIHIVNEDVGTGWRPTVTTDSEALGFLNGAACTASLEIRRTGPVVRIFARLPQERRRIAL